MRILQLSVSVSRAVLMARRPGRSSDTQRRRSLSCSKTPSAAWSNNDGELARRTTLWLVVPVDDTQFQTLLEQVRELHKLADEFKNSKTRIDANVRARLNWESEPPWLPAKQSEVADAIVELLATQRLSSSQARQLQRAFFGK